MAFDLAGRKFGELPLSYTVDVDPWTGIASFRVIVPAAPGREAIGPALSLVYSSGAGNSELGVGWTLAGIPALGIDTSEHAPRWDGTDGFQLAGNRLVPWLERTSSGWRRRTRTTGRWTVTYYRSELGGGQVRVEQWVDTTSGRMHFRTRDARNVLTVYGARPTAAGRIADPDDESRTFTWLPELRVDPHGTAMWLEYARETLDGVDRTAPYEPKRPALAQRYLKTVRYSNTRPLTVDDDVAMGVLPAGLRWCFHTVLDYGDHGDTPRVDPDRPWPARLDPTTSTRPGFPVRTYRLCHRILTFHHFDELGAGATLVGAMSFAHDENAGGSTLRQIDYTGYRRDGEVITSAAVPPLVMSYAPAAIDAAFEPVPVTTAENAPAGLARRNVRFVDLFGDGLPGILTEVDRTWHYKENAGGGAYSAEAIVVERPSVRDASGSLGDYDSDGDTDLADLAGRLAGRFTIDRETRQWRGFAPFTSFPHVEALGARARWVDLNCDGRLDVVIPKHDSLVWFESRGDEFAPPIEVPLPPGFEPTLDADPALDLFFADMNGDGAPDLVRVRDGSVEYWPSLGNGCFGERVVMEGAPQFARSGDFDASRLRFVDLDGSGTADLLYLDGGEVACWFNACGNQLVEGPRLVGLPYLDNVSNVRVLDFLGEGRPCLVWSNPLPGRASPIEYLPLAPQLRPRLLLSVDDSRGAEHRLSYSSSAAHYLRDRNAGRPWSTVLPTHYQVVDRREVIDHIAKTRSVSTYEYHDGFYDGTRRERRGFGQVDQFDEDVLDVAAPQPGSLAVTPASKTRLWFHLGTTMWGAHQPAHLYAGDPDLPVLAPHSIYDPIGLVWKDVEQGLRGLAGLPIRRETWAYDPVTGTSPEHPFSVEQTSYELHCEQPSPGFRTAKTESVTATYEQRGGDPRIVHQLIVATDAYGLPLRDVQIAYARRPGKPRDVAAQDRNVVLVHDHGLVSFDTDDRFELGLPVEGRSYELAGVRPDPTGLFTVAQLNTSPVVQALASSASHEVILDDDPAIGPRARTTSWDRAFYWNDTRDAALARGQIGRVMLVHHEESACFSSAFATSVFGAHADDARLTALGYEQKDGLWWAAGDVHHFAPLERFSQRVAIERADGARVTYEYDAPCLETIAITDPLGHRAEAALDYHTVTAYRVTDANGTVTEVRHDPLGIVVSATRRGHVGTQPWGFEPMSAITPAPVSSLSALLADPGALLQGGARAAWYDLDAWRRDGTPPVFIGLRQERLRYDGDGHVDTQGAVVTVVSYLDGFRRVLQEKARTVPGPAIQRDTGGAVVVDASGRPVLGHSEVRWRATGHVVYDAKQRVARAFEPFFTPTFAFESDDVLEQLGLATLSHYDAIGRLVGQDLTDGTFTRITYAPWSIDREDANDTVLESVYRATREGLPASDPRKQALEHAKTHAGTTSTRYLDPFGREVGSLARGGATAEDRRMEVAHTAEGHIAQITDARGLVAFQYRHDMRGRRMSEHTIDAGDRRALFDALGRPRWMWNDRGFEIELGLDLVDRPLYTHVRGGDGPTSLDHRVEEWQYAESLDPTAAAAVNLLGRAVAARDASGEATFDRYDPDGHVLSAARRFRTVVDNTPDWRGSVSLDPEVFTTGAAFDALGRVTQQLLPDGSTRSHTYLPGGPRTTTRISTTDGTVSDLLVLAGSSFDARGRRDATSLGNGVEIRYEYELDGGRVRSQVATLGTRTLQDLEYTFDPVGNLVRLTDAAQEGPQAILGGASARRDYTYDAHYRLRTATGRIHQALLQYDYIPGTNGTAKGTRHLSLQNAAATERYTELFDYDTAGNLRSMRHVGTSQSWTTDMWISPSSNRALPAVDPNGNAIVDPEAKFDAAGNLRELAHLRRMDWSWRNALDRVVLIERPGATDDDERYVYSSDGLRARRVTTRVVTGDVVEVEEKLYFAGCERKRIRRGSNVLLDRWSSHVDDGGQRIAIIHRWIVDQSARETDDVTRAHVRYQLVTHQGSSALELDQDGRVISYEEYLPFGGSAFLAGDRVREVDVKEYRYSGKECDDATNLYYYGHRYYAPWLGRWLSPDPAGITDGLNLYQFVLGNPITNVDPDGLQASGDTDEPPEVENYAVQKTADIPEWARAAWANLSQAERNDIRAERARLIPTEEGGAKLISEEEYQAIIAAHPNLPLNNYIVGGAPQEGDSGRNTAGVDPDSAHVTTYDFAAEDVNQMAQEDDDDPGTDGDGALPVKTTDGNSLKGATTPGPSAKVATPSTGAGTRPTTTSAQGTSTDGGGTGASGTGPGAGSKGTGTGGGGTMMSTGSGGAATAAGGGATAMLGAGGGAAADTGASGGARKNGSGAGAMAMSGTGSVGAAAVTTTGGATGNPHGVDGGLENGVEGGTGTHEAKPGAQHVDHPGEGGTGTQAGGSTDPNLSPSTTGGVNVNVKQQGTDPAGSIHGSPDGKLGGREGGRPDGSKGGTHQAQHTDGEPDGRPDGSGDDGTPDGKAGVEHDALDVATRIAGFANFEFDAGKGNGSSRGVPGGHGHRDLGWFGQFAYIAVTVLSWLGPAAVFKAFRGGAKLAGRALGFLSRFLGGAETHLAVEAEEKGAAHILTEAGALEHAPEPPEPPPAPSTPPATPSAATTVATTWRQHEALVTQALRDAHPGVTVGEQVTLDVTNTATNETVRIRIDNVYPDNGAYQLVDAKFSAVNDLTTSSLENTVTANQSIVYDWIRTGKPVEVVPAGENAIRAGLTPGVPITIAPTVEMHVNSPNGIVVRTY